MGPFWLLEMGPFWLSEMGPFWLSEMGPFWLSEMGPFWPGAVLTGHQKYCSTPHSTHRTSTRSIPHSQHCCSQQKASSSIRPCRSLSRMSSQDPYAFSLLFWYGVTPSWSSASLQACEVSSPWPIEDAFVTSFCPTILLFAVSREETFNGVLLINFFPDVDTHLTRMLQRLNRFAGREMTALARAAILEIAPSNNQWSGNDFERHLD